jgi:hypothetical protein
LVFWVFWLQNLVIGVECKIRLVFNRSLQHTLFFILNFGHFSISECKIWWILNFWMQNSVIGNFPNQNSVILFFTKKFDYFWFLTLKTQNNNPYIPKNSLINPKPWSQDSITSKVPYSKNPLNPLLLVILNPGRLSAILD